MGKQSKSIPRSCQQLATHEINECEYVVATTHNASANYFILSADLCIPAFVFIKILSRCRLDGRTPSLTSARIQFEIELIIVHSRHHIRCPTAGIIADRNRWRETLSVCTEDTSLPCRPSHRRGHMSLGDGQHCLNMSSNFLRAVSQRPLQVHIFLSSSLHRS